jgi:uncharacterized protein YcbK (DUF882 family)
MGFEERPSQVERLSEKEHAGIEYNDQQDDYEPEEIQKEARVLEDPERNRKQKRYPRKLDLILMLTTSILYFFESLDRGNIVVSCSVTWSFLCGIIEQR